jgi:hypothetical protein
MVTMEPFDLAKFKKFLLLVQAETKSQKITANYEAGI